MLMALVLCILQQQSNGANGSSSRREVSFSERYSSMDTQKVVLTVNQGLPRELGAGQVAKLSWEEHVSIWQVDRAPQTQEKP